MTVAPEAVRSVAVVGGGLIGAGMASLFAANGLAVRIHEPDGGRHAALPGIVAEGVARRAELHGRPSVIGPVHVTADLEEALTAAEFVQEAVPEREEIKIPLLARIDELLDPACHIASSTSALLPSRLQSGIARHPGRFLVAHPINPPYLIPLVELVGGARTDAAALGWSRAFFARLGCRPIIVHREVEGHVANRLSAAIWREAVSLVLEGVATIDEVDDAMRFGPGLRLAWLGPFGIYELAGGAGGFRHYLDHLGYTQERRWRSLSDRTTLDAAERDRLIGAAAGVMSGSAMRSDLARRDEALVAMLRAFAVLREEGGRKQ